MSTAATQSALPPVGGQHYFLLRRLHSLTGILFGGYVIVHLIVNATLAQGGAVYKTQVEKIHDLPFLPAIEWTFLFLPLIYHALYGIWITITGQWNAPSYPFGKNWLYVVQRISAVVLVVFVAFHVLALKYGLFGANFFFDAHHPTKTVVQHLQFSHFIAYVFYPIGLFAACFHLANGFWTGAITWGLTVSAAAQRRWGLLCIAIFFFTFVAAMTSLLAALRLDPKNLGLL